ncbi:hypothetical protein B296_00053954 [Ensete ventricosum]|uniref:Uncharacterized protein n=1 Tax=Ensete ventricosum TaxID=4639 RepID=A0A426X5Q2_ENSVE|nr:hypothetical protein B296_00053954 [Ensete ventricosum]
MRVTVCLSIDQGELLGGHSGVEVGGRKGRGSDDESSGAQLPKSKVTVRKEVDSEEHHNIVEADLPIMKEGMHMQGNRYHKRDQGGGKCIGKLHVPRQDGRAEAKELHKTDVDGLLIKIAESEKLQVDAGVLDQGMK